MSEVDYVRLLPDEKAESEDCVSNPTGSDLILARDSVKHYVRRLNLIIILSAILSITLLDAAHIVLRSGEFPEYLYNIWFTSHTIDVIVLTLFASLAGTVLEGRYSFPIIVSVIDDVILCIFIAYAAIVGGGNAFAHADWCGIDWDSLIRRPGPQCNELHFALRVLMDLGVILAAVVSTCHFALMLLRCRAIYDTRFWRRSFPRGFAPGRFSFRVAVHILERSSIPKVCLERCEDGGDIWRSSDV